MTEDEAKTKWCPFARVVNKGDQGAAHNRMGLDEGNFAGLPVTALCIASACMAWRWTTTPGQAKTRADWSPKATQDMSPENLTANGYCGLAGRPDLS